MNEDLKLVCGKDAQIITAQFISLCWKAFPHPESEHSSTQRKEREEKEFTFPLSVFTLDSKALLPNQAIQGLQQGDSPYSGKEIMIQSVSLCDLSANVLTQFNHVEV